MLAMTLSQRIKTALEGAGLLKDLNQAAEKIGVGRSAMYPWLKGETKNLKLENLFALADATGYSAKWIAIEEGPDKLSAQNGELDLSFLATVIQEVERFLEKERRTLEADKKAKLITLLYEIHVGRGNVQQPAIARYLRLVV